MDISDRLSAAMARNGVTQYRLAKLSKVPQPTIQRILSRETLNPQMDTLRKLGDALGESLDGLMGSEAAGVKNLPAGTRVPLVQWPTLGAESGLYLPPANDGEWRFCPVTCGPRTFAVRVPATDAMMAVGSTSYPPGCVIYVDPDQLDPPHGKPVLAKLESTGEIVFKVFMTEAGRTWLRSLNPAYPAIHGGFRVVGTIIGKWEDS